MSPRRLSFILVVRPTHRITCGADWRGTCGSTARDRPDRQVDALVGRRHSFSILAFITAAFVTKVERSARCSLYSRSFRELSTKISFAGPASMYATAS